MTLMFAFKLYRISFRMMFGPKHPYRKEYDWALDVLQERGHWLYLYDKLDGPNGAQVCEALKKWIEAYQAKKQTVCLLGEDIEDWKSNEQQLKKELHVLIYGEFTEGVHGYVSDDE
jgi:hypothetical protein